MSIPSINYTESKAILGLLATLKTEANRYSKLCFSEDGKDVGIETASSIYRTTLSTASYVSNFLNQTAQNFGIVSSTILPIGWSRDIQTLIPITQRIAEQFTTDSLDQQDALVAIDLLAEAIDGLKALQKNQYNDPSQEQKAAIINTAMNALEGARNALVNNYSEPNCCTHEICTKNLQKENKELLETIRQLREENDRLRQELIRKDKEMEQKNNNSVEANLVPNFEEGFILLGNKLEEIRKKFTEYHYQ